MVDMASGSKDPDGRRCAFVEGRRPIQVFLQGDD
jgi:hypothetical protein